MRNVLIVGCGNISGRWIEALRTNPSARIAGLCDVRPEAAKTAAARHALDVPVFGDLGEALKDSAADTAVVLTPPGGHLEVARTATAAGLDVLSEKPMAETLRDARAICNLADQTGRRVLVMQNRRYLPGIRALRDALASGEVGEIGMVNADMFLGAHFVKGDFRYTMEHPLLVDMLIHTFDEARFLLGDRRILSAYCQEFNPKNSWYRHDASAVCVFEAEDGAVLSVRASWATRAGNTTAAGKWRVHCLGGAAGWDGADRVWVSPASPLPDTDGYFEEEGVRHDVPLPPMRRTEHAACIDAMLSALESGASLDTECHGNLQSLKMVHACVKSSALGRKVQLSELD